MSTHAPEPVLLVIIGATGDLTRRKLLPALGALAARGQLPQRMALLGVARDPHPDDAAFRAIAREALSALDESRIHYQTIGGGAAADFARIAADIAAIERENDLPGNRIFYLALPPQARVSSLRSHSAGTRPRPRRSTRCSIASSTSRRSTGSITTSERRPSGT